MTQPTPQADPETKTRKIRTILVDDEPLALRGLTIRLQDYDDIDVVASCANGREAIKVIRREKPDLVFLDIQMPGLDGFAVVRSLVGTQLPLVIFVTAFDQYALDAFESHALDYLLKPVDDDRLREAIERVKEQLFQRQAVEQNARLVDLIESMDDPPKAALTAILDAPALEPGEAFESHLHIRDRGRITIVPVEDIDYIDAAGDYMCIHVGTDTHILRETMKQMSQRLNPETFARIHRSTIVNLERVREVRPHHNGECFLALKTGAELKVSRSHKDVVARFL